MNRQSRMNLIVNAMFLSLLSLCPVDGSRTARAASFHGIDQVIQMTSVSSKIVVQLDTTTGSPNIDSFTVRHSVIDSGVDVRSLGRGFYCIGVLDGTPYSDVHDSLMEDSLVKRVNEVYATTTGGMELRPTDLLHVRFLPDVSAETALNALSNLGLQLSDSSSFSHNLWQVVIVDSNSLANPVDLANELNDLEITEWASPAFFSDLINFAVPEDPLYVNQYYLQNQLWNNDVDIDADSAWLLPLVDSTLKIAVADEGIAAHEDLPAERLVDAYSVFWPNEGTAPGSFQGHGIACAGIIAASHNTTGIKGIFGSCRLVPIKIRASTSEVDDVANPWDYAEGIRYAQFIGARVLSLSVGYKDWGFPHTAIVDAIKYVTEHKDGLSPNPSIVVVAASGNFAAELDGVMFPANMEQVISVGAIASLGTPPPVWYYSSRGDSLDLVAPSGNLLPSGDVWSTDQMNVAGWNPTVTGWSDAGGNSSYTGRMGGTSACSPQVAGIAGLLIARRPELVKECSTYVQIRNIICSSAVDLGTAGRDDDYGFGMANAYHALASLCRGDLNNSGAWDVTDVVGIVEVAFRNGATPGPFWRYDVNCDGVVQVTDVVFVVGGAFRNSPPPRCYRFNY